MDLYLYLSVDFFSLKKPKQLKTNLRSLHKFLYCRNLWNYWSSLLKSEAKNNDTCYVCRRTLNESKNELRKAIDKTSYFNHLIDMTEKELNNKKKPLLQYLSNIIKNTEKTNLDFKIQSAANDRDAFRKIIPIVTYLT